MKALLSALAITTLAMTGCAAGPYDSSCSYGRSYQPAGNTYYDYNHTYRPAQTTYYPSRQRYYDCDRTVVVGPQYYRGTDNSWGAVRYKNYSDAPLVIKRPHGTVIIPKSWD